MIQIHLFLHHKLNYDNIVTSIHHQFLFVSLKLYPPNHILLYTSLYNISNEIILNVQIKSLYYLNMSLQVLIKLQKNQ